ncbi:hypothetical protein CLI64_06530 [Nostoc sp. CENA543]|nr:hypothetical protein CLI64_06530 [Nostoc sp. CENA543]
MQCLTAIKFPGTSIEANGGAYFDSEDCTEYPDFLEHQFSNAGITSPPTPLLRGNGSLPPPSLVGKGAGGLGF